MKHFLLIFIVCFTIISCKKNPPNYAQDIAPIIIDKCSKCHNKNGVAPFSLTTFDEVKKRAKSIAFVTKTRYMPPWPADPNYSHFAGENILSDNEIELIQLWVKNDCPTGDLAKAPKAPIYLYQSYFGKPDLTLYYKDTIYIKGDNIDRFFLMKLPYELPFDTIIKAVEFVPGNSKAIHHVNGHLIQYKPNQKNNIHGGKFVVNTDSGQAENVYQTLDVANDDGSFPMLTQSAINYLPGVLPTMYPEGITGYRISKKGAFLFKDIHYGPSPKDTFDFSHLNIFFAKKTPDRITRELQMGTLGITDIEPPLVIPPNEIKKFITKAYIKKDISILTINPHMHKLGKSFLAYAITNKNDTIPLIRINKWDFNWQYFYTFQKMVKIPAGSVIIAEGVYDNTVNNTNNPFHPPRQVSERMGSMRATDEMFQFIITLSDYQVGDENISLE